MGAIIGKGGSRLNHIRHESMANIRLDSDMHSAERTITISGAAEEVENAKELLRMWYVPDIHSFIHSFTSNTYLVSLQENYSDMLPNSSPAKEQPLVEKRT